MKRGGGENLPEWQRSRSLRGRVYFREQNGTLVAQSWPKKRGKPKSATTRQQNNLFAATVKAIRDVDPNEREAAEILAHSTFYTWRDILFMSMHGEYVQIEGLSEMSVQDMLDSISNTPGAMLVRGDLTWIGLMPPSLDAVLLFDVATHMPYWADPATVEFGGLYGDVSADGGPGAQEATLSPTGVIPGTYTNTTLAVDSAGRITAAASGAPDTGITALTGDVSAGPTSGSAVATLVNTPVTAGDYHHATVSVDSKGRLTAAANGAVATTSAVGLVKPDGSSLSITAGGTMSVIGATVSPFGLPTTLTAAASAALDFTGLTGLNYLLIGRGLVPTVDAAFAYLRFGTGAGPTWAASNYRFAGRYNGSTGTNGPLANNGGNQIELAGNVPSNTSIRDGCNFIVNIHVTAQYVVAICNIHQDNTDTLTYQSSLVGRWERAGAALTGIRFLFNNGTVKQGTLSLYALNQ
jgi:hypothetical protein